ncbi:hypothetical protein ACU62C_26445, partial [Klebsiella aerogenes]
GCLVFLSMAAFTFHVIKRISAGMFGKNKTEKDRSAPQPEAIAPEPLIRRNQWQVDDNGRPGIPQEVQSFTRHNWAGMKAVQV